MAMRDWANIEADIKLLESVMRKKLSENEHKGYWADISLLQLRKYLEDEVEELSDAILMKTLIDVMLEAGDIANYAAMICS
ncbi:MAG: hypothetical protein ACQ5SW_10445, partial [Sphaerochaetaceae bacterium]